MQFYAIEIARNRSGLNDWIYEANKKEGGTAKVEGKVASKTMEDTKLDHKAADGKAFDDFYEAK